MDIASIEPYLDRRWIDQEKNTSLVRRGARAKLVYEGLYSMSGYFGNECHDGHIYQCAALVVKMQPYAKRMGRKKAPAKSKAENRKR